MDDLTTLGISPADRKKLESMGFTTLEQIALLDWYKLGMGKSKGNTLVKRAKNVLANRNIEKIVEISDSRIRIKVKKVDKAIIESVKSALGAYSNGYGNATVHIEENIITFHPHPTAMGNFSYVVQNAKNLESILQAKERDELSRKGIEMEEKEIIDFAKARGFNGFWQSVFSEIRGNEIMKKALSVALFSSYEEPAHVLVLGEPGSSKTLAKEIITRNLKDVSPIGGNTTRAGLVCSLATGQPGILAASNKKLVLIDEFDKIPKEDVEYCYELLSNGKCTIHSARVHQDIESRFIAIAFANPRTEVFTEKPMEDIGLPLTLMSRFALVVKTENLTEDEEMDLLRKKFYGEAEIRKMPEHYDQWIKLARLYKPEIIASRERVESYIKRAKEIIGKHRLTPIRRDYRMGDYSRWIPMAIARAEFSDVTNEVIDKAEEILIASIQSWS